MRNVVYGRPQMRTIQYFLDSNNFFLSLENVLDSRKSSFFIQIQCLQGHVPCIIQRLYCF